MPTGGGQLSFDSIQVLRTQWGVFYETLLCTSRYKHGAQILSKVVFPVNLFAAAAKPQALPCTIVDWETSIKYSGTVECERTFAFAGIVYERLFAACLLADGILDKQTFCSHR
jgi:hypothetical protein